MSDKHVKHSARLVTVDSESAKRRVDNFLLSELKGLPRSRIYSMIRKGEVRVNKGRTRAAYKLAEGDIVRIPPVSKSPVMTDKSSDGAKSDWILRHILHEDDCLLVLDKPSGLAVHGGSGISLGAVELLRASRPDCHYLELVHRLDRETSGCLLLAKKRSALRRMHELFREGKVEKVYQALLLGEWQGGDREVDLPLVVNNRKNAERFVRPGNGGKASLTRFYPEEYLDDAVLVRVELLTGRTHQIRAHAAAIGHPVAGDERYGEGTGIPVGLKRLFLHAGTLSFIHPGTGKRVRYTSPLDPALQKLVTGLERT
ncbi:MAG: RluA family pseudouridine synthase [Gammaproteobacteria bacterium]|nr:RluA family pseudouridine synthase [Gammaproteobacteria bacterium]MCP4088765.1 RluA family pseudouridine synthase [Gammaproteobacteria bacterium]MCP4275936.1 RluA family pseudouridine synthase [Gammaproteobacteria bacterium]MCP4832152.1 RluA family pseudouridine synthase [Gammaproteobacteria bacterium]